MNEITHSKFRRIFTCQRGVKRVRLERSEEPVSAKLLFLHRMRTTWQDRAKLDGGDVEVLVCILCFMTGALHSTIKIYLVKEGACISNVFCNSWGLAAPGVCQSNKPGILRLSQVTKTKQ